MIRFDTVIQMCMIKEKQYLFETSWLILIILIIFKKENIKLMSETFREKKDIILCVFFIRIIDYYKYCIITIA